MLRTTSLQAGYGKMTVLRDIDLTVSAGEVVLVLGPNGAGKTTLLRTLSGLLPPQGGEIYLDGKSISGLSAENIARAGVRHVLEGHRIFPDLSVEDNVRIGQIARIQSERVSEEKLFSEVYELFPVLGEKRKSLARNLSGGQQQMLAFSQARASKPISFLCDEPSLGLAQALIPEMLNFLRARADEGAAVLLVEQLVEQPLVIADRVLVLRQGEIVAEGSPAEFSNHESVTRMMFGLA